MVPRVVLPDAFESTPIRPRHHPVPVTPASFEIALILSFFDFSFLYIVTGWQTVVILKRTGSIGPAVFEGTHELVSILVGHFGLPVEPAIEKRASFVYIILINVFHLLFLWLL